MELKMYGLNGYSFILLFGLGSYYCGSTRVDCCLSENHGNSSMFQNAEFLDAMKTIDEMLTVNDEIINSMTLTEDSDEEKQNDESWSSLRKSELLQYFKDISGNQTISGVFAVQSDPWVEVIHNITGVLPGMLTTTIPNTMESKKWQSFTDQVISNWNRGHLVSMFWWMYANPLLTMEVFRATEKVSADKIWVDLTEDGRPLNVEWKNQLDLIAPYFLQLQEAGVIPICDFFPFINVNISTYLWNNRKGPNGSQKLIKLTRDYLTTKHGLNSIIWAWSLFSEDDMTQLEEYWPGNKYVDVVSVYMENKKELTTEEYENLLELVGDTPIAMEEAVYVPTTQLLAEQPRWTWFTCYDSFVYNQIYNTVEKVNNTFHSVSVINQGQIELFNKI